MNTERAEWNMKLMISATSLVPAYCLILFFFSFLPLEINGTQICPTGLVSLHAASSDLENAPRLRYLRLDGNLLKPPIPLDLMLCFRLLQSVIF